MGIGVARRRAQRAFFFSAYKAGQAQRCKGVWEYASPGRVSIMRVLLMPSGTTKTTQNWTITQAIHRMVVSRSPFLRIRGTGTELSLGSCSFESFMFAG